MNNQPIKISPSGLYGGLRIADNVTKRVVRTKLNIFNLLNVNTVCKINVRKVTQGYGMCVER
jgi:hypothetical protein